MLAHFSTATHLRYPGDTRFELHERVDQCKHVYDTTLADHGGAEQDFGVVLDAGERRAVVEYSERL